MPRALLLCLSSLCLVVACGDDDASRSGGGGGGREQSAGAEDEDAEDTEIDFAGLSFPPLPRDVELEEGPLAEGLASARRAIALERPTPDASMSSEQMQGWVQGAFATWIRERGALIRETATRLAPDDEDEVGEYVVVSTLLGALLARFAEDVATMPLPTAVQEDEGSRIRYRDAFLTVARPLWERAMDAFGACASASVRARDPRVRAWGTRCDEEVERAQAAPRPLPR